MANTTETIRQIEDKLARQESRANITLGVTLVLGVIVLGLLIYNFNRAATVFEEGVQPQELSRMVVQQVTPKLENMNVEAFKFVKEHAPGALDKTISKALTETIPNLRKQGQEALQAAAISKFDEQEKEIYTAVDTTLETYGDQVRRFASELSTEEGSQAFEDSLYDLLSETLTSQEMAIELESYGTALQEISGTFDHLVNSEELTQEEEALYRLIAITREIASRVQPQIDEARKETTMGIPVE